MNDFATTYLTLVVLAAALVTLAWLLAGFLLAFTNDGGDITDKPIRGLPRQPEVRRA
jgi:ammonia channel protein AmtB